MGDRGRESGAALATLKAGVEAVVRPDAPYDLTDEEADEWRAVVDRMPAEWFPRETHGLLTLYCRHLIAARRVSQLVSECLSQKAVDVVEYDRLLKMQERESRAASSLATRMRISQQSTFDKEKKKPITMKKPWQN